MIVPNLLSLGVFEATVGSSASTSFAAFSFWIVVPLVGGIGLLCLDQVSVEFKRHIAGNSQIVAPSAGGSTQILPFLWIKSLRDESRCVKLDFDKEQRLSERFLFSSDTYGTLLHTHTCWLGLTRFDTYPSAVWLNVRVLLMTRLFWCRRVQLQTSKKAMEWTKYWNSPFLLFRPPKVQAVWILTNAEKKLTVTDYQIALKT